MGTMDTRREPIGTSCHLFSNTFPDSKEHLISAIDSEIRAINDEMSCHPCPDERTMEHANVRLGQFFQSGLVQKMAALKKADPSFNYEEEEKLPEGEEDADDGLSKKDKEEKNFYEEMEQNNFMFTTETRSGNKVGGRWRKALAASESMRKDLTPRGG